MKLRYAITEWSVGTLEIFKVCASVLVELIYSRPDEPNSWMLKTISVARDPKSSFNFPLSDTEIYNKCFCVGDTDSQVLEQVQIKLRQLAPQYGYVFNPS